MTRRLCMNPSVDTGGTDHNNRHALSRHPSNALYGVGGSRAAVIVREYCFNYLQPKGLPGLYHSNKVYEPINMISTEYR